MGLLFFRIPCLDGFYERGNQKDNLLFGGYHTKRLTDIELNWIRSCIWLA